MARPAAVISWLLLLLNVFLTVEGARGPVVYTSNDLLDVYPKTTIPGTGRSVFLSNRTNCGADDVPPPARVDTTVRVQNLIDLLIDNGYAAYIIPTGDEHQSEYPPERDERRAYISGLTGSSGTAVVFANGTRALWTDSRYFLEADDELDCNWLLMKSGLAGVPTIEEYLIELLEPGDIVAADAKHIGYSTWETYVTDLSVDGIILEASIENLVDIVWDADVEVERPLYSNASAFIHDVMYAGQTVVDKLIEVRADIASHSADGLFITALDEVAWLYNIRGEDVLYNPVVKSYSLVTATEAVIFVDVEKITDEVQAHLDAAGVTVQPFEEALVELESFSTTATTVLLPDDSLTAGCSYEVFRTVDAAKRTMVIPATLSLKAQKNPTEIEQMTAAHILDAVAVIDWLAYIEQQVQAGEEWTELSAQNLLTTYRASQENFVDLSFEAISGYGPNGAIVHYAASELTAMPLGTDSLYLIDSGGQYLGATTDITRTVHFGNPSSEMIEMYTRVLMGMIDFGTAVFPAGTTNSEVDILARRPIYEVGLDYRHGTSHGIGMFLNVHEPKSSTYAPRQVMSDEPGYYKDGEYGIRIENQLYVQETDMVFDVPYYTFTHMTLVPFEPKLIDLDLLSDQQIDWLNEYYQSIRDIVGPVLTEQERTAGYDWMMSKTEPHVRDVCSYTNPPTDGASTATLCSLLLFVSIMIAAMRNQ